MRTVVSIPDDVCADADRIAHRLGLSRSQLYGRALREFVERHDASAVTAALDTFAASKPTGDAFVARAGRCAVERSDW